MGDAQTTSDSGHRRVDASVARFRPDRRYGQDQIIVPASGEFEPNHAHLVGSGRCNG
jgi:hypothetical protein